MKVRKLLTAATAGAVVGVLLDVPIRKAWNATGARLLAALGVEATLPISGEDRAKE